LRYELAGMTPTQMTRLAEQIVGFQRRVTTLPPGAGYGYVGLGEMGAYTSWWDLICSANASVPASRFEAYLRQVSPVCFLDDITVKNVIVQDGKLQGLIDFDCVCYGDPLYWLALTSVGVVSDVGTAGHYVSELKRLWSLTSQQEQVLAFYCASMAQDFMRRAAAQETPEWNARMQAATEDWLAQCAR
jgi:aminoglycoside phosphotransferase (APT) family kinase protein